MPLRALAQVGVRIQYVRRGQPAHRVIEIGDVQALDRDADAERVRRSVGALDQAGVAGPQLGVGEVTDGTATLDGADLLAMEPEERAAAGLFLAFQYPVEIPGIGNMTFLRTALNAQRKARGEAELSAGDFLKEVRAKAKTLKIDAEMLKRPVNVGFSGGEKKRNEILQMAMLEPKMCILDETDSGLDVDAMKLVADGVNALRDGKRSFLVITHYQRLLDHIKPDVVHIMAAGRIVKTGGPELALEVEHNGYADILAEG